MQKSERLFHLLNLLRGRRTVVTAATLAEQLNVSERTIYRDIQSLILSGVPLEGEAGVGYRLQRHFELPPLMFDADEVEALLLGARMVRAWSDQQLAASANSALQKILAVLPCELRERDRQSPLLVPLLEEGQECTVNKQILRTAIAQQQQVQLLYTRADAVQSNRLIEPLGLVFWGKVWTLIAWCQLRHDYRMFRLDRINGLTVSEQQFETNSHKSLNHYLQLVREQYQVECGNMLQ